MSTSTAFAEPDVLSRRIAILLEAGRVGAARPLLAALRRMAPPSAETVHLSARLAMREERLADAAAELDGALESDPHQAELRKLRAELRLRCGDVTGAAADAAEAVVSQPHDASAKALLGVVLLERGQYTDAVACLQEAVRAHPANAAFLQGLAAAQEATGDATASALTLEAAIVACPHVAALRAAAIMEAMRAKDWDRAIAGAEAARLAGAADACVFGLKGHALSNLGRHDDAAEAYRSALALAPEDPYVRHLVAASGTLPSADRAPAPYLRAVFDGYAARFEGHIVALGYRVPGLVCNTLRRHLPNLDGAGPVLDLGCGTGLVAVACSDLPLGRWEGVDVSRRMLDEAARKGIYAALHEADLVGWLAADLRAWPIIVGADVFCYFGALERVLLQIRDRLRPDGIVVASFEELEGAIPGRSEGGQPGWLLRQQGRYVHRPDYVETAARAAGLRLRHVDRQVLRQEGNAPVPGLLITFEHDE